MRAPKNGWWLGPIGAALLVLGQAASSPSLLADTDTAFLLKIIRERGSPLSWFTGDWPLGNHFYRPVSTLTFELDARLYGSAAWGYGLTNALLAAACVLLLAWFVVEVTAKPGWAVASSALFALWTVGAPMDAALAWAPWIALAGFAAYRLRRDGTIPLKPVLALTCLLVAAAWEAGGFQALRFRMIDWLPGRTASTMTVFALFALGAYARSLDLHAGVERRAWQCAAVLGLALALGSYEQAVMLPAAFLALWAVAGRGRPGGSPWVHAAFWSVLAGYIALRVAVLPGGESTYQAQQLRDGTTAWLSAGEYVFPPIFTLHQWGASWDLGFAVLLVPALYEAAGLLVAMTVAYGLALFAKPSVRRAALAGWALSWISFLPMAWVKPFEHYHFWPMAMRALLAVACVALAVEYGRGEPADD